MSNKCKLCGKECRKGTPWYEDGYCSAEHYRENTCRYCHTDRKEGVEWYDNDYCSGKCKKLDGGQVRPEAKPSKDSGYKASLEDYLLDYPKKLGEKDARGQRIKGRTPKRYARRFEPERLYWGEYLMTAPQLKQAGFRAARKPIPGDWDFEPKENLCATEVAALHEEQVGKETEND
jgi:hypothetical protein